MDSDILTVTQAATYLSIAPQTLRRWARKSLIPSFKINTRGDRRFRKSELIKYLEENSK